MAVKLAHSVLSALAVFYIARGMIATHGAPAGWASVTACVGVVVVLALTRWIATEDPATKGGA